MGVSLLDPYPHGPVALRSQVRPRLIRVESTMELQGRCIKHLVGPITCQLLDPRSPLIPAATTRWLIHPRQSPRTHVVLAHYCQRVNLTIGLPKIRRESLIMAAVTRCSVWDHRRFMARFTGHAVDRVDDMRGQYVWSMIQTQAMGTSWPWGDGS